MSGAIAYDLKELPKFQKIIRDLEKRGVKVEKPLKRFGVHMLRQTALTFKRGGRGSVKWKPIAEVTRIMRKFRKRGGGRTGPKRTLEDTGHMKRSIKTVTFIHKKTKAQAVYTRVPYAKTHQEGGTITIPARTIRPKNKKALAFVPHKGRSGGGQLVIVKKVEQPKMTKKVPRRQFLFFEEKDKTRALRLLQIHAKETATKTGKR